MAWIMDEYSTIKGGYQPSVVTGKPIEIGGSWGREEATGVGCYKSIELIKQKINKKKLNFKKETAIVQGFGNLGMTIARLLSKKYRVIAVSDSQGGIINQGGLDIPCLIQHKQDFGRVKDYRGA